MNNENTNEISKCGMKDFKGRPWIKDDPWNRYPANINEFQEPQPTIFPTTLKNTTQSITVTSILENTTNMTGYNSPFLPIESFSFDSLEVYSLFAIVILLISLILLLTIHYLILKKKIECKFKSDIKFATIAIFVLILVKMTGFGIFLIKCYKMGSLFVRSTKLKIINATSISLSLIFVVFYLYILLKVESEIVLRGIHSRLSDKRKKSPVKIMFNVITGIYLLMVVFFMISIIINCFISYHKINNILTVSQNIFFSVINVLDVVCSVLCGLILSKKIKKFISEDLLNERIPIELDVLRLNSVGKSKDRLLYETEL